MTTMLNEGAGFDDLTPLVTADRVAWYLGITKARVYRLCEENLLPHCRAGRSLRFSPSDIVRWAESGGSCYPGGWRKEAVR